MDRENLDVESISRGGHAIKRGLTFGVLLRQLRKRAGMTQADLAAAVDFSISHISNLEKDQRLPAVAVVLEKFIPAFGLQEEPRTAQRLVELAADARGEQTPADLYQRMSRRSVAHSQLTQNVQSPLPSPLLPILGRERDLTLIENRLLSHQGRLFTLIGPPGIGKTTLGLAVAARLQASFEDGVYFVPLASITDPAQVGSALMNGLGLTENSTRLLQARLVEYLRQKHLLIVLDNFEQLLAAAPLLIHLLQECPGLHFLITSRAALRAQAEQRFKVAALAPDIAVHLFVQRAQAVEPDFTLTNETAPIVKQICHRLDCLPLAIELIAPQINLFTPQELLAHLHDHSLDLLYNEAPDLGPRHQTLRRAIQHSYALLSIQEQAFFRQLGVFSGSFDLPASEALWEHVQTAGESAARLLAALVNKSLVQVETRQQQQRFKLLETLREFALEQLRGLGELDTTRRRHAAYFCQLAEIANPLLRGADEILWLDRLDANHDNLRAAVAWSLASPPDLETGLRLVAMLWWFWYMRGYMREGLDWLNTALMKDGGHFPALRAKILQGACTFTWANRISDYKRKSRVLIEESITLYRQLDDPWNLAKSLGYLGFSAETPEEFVTAAQEARQLFGRINDAWGLAWIYVMELYVTQFTDQHILIEEGIRLMRSIDAKFGLALTLESAALQAYHGGDYERARLYVEEAIVTYHQTGEKWTLAQALFVLADILITQNQWHELAEICAQGLLLAQQTGASAVEAQLHQRQKLLLEQRLKASVAERIG